MYNPDYKIGLLRTLEAERSKNKVLKRKLAALNDEVQDLSAEGESMKYLLIRSQFISRLYLKG